MKRAKSLDRALLRKLLGMLGSSHDGEVVNAARRIHAMVQRSGMDWETLLPDIADFAPPSESNDDLLRLEELLSSEYVADILKIRLRDMRISLSNGKLSPADRKLLRVLHRKAVIDGVVVESRST